MAVKRQLRVERFGRLSHIAGQALQDRRHADVAQNAADDTLFLLEHTPVITTGRNAGLTHLRASPAALAAQGIDLVTTNRGGDVTYHGPGQLVGYPIIALQPGEQDLKRYVTCLEEILIRTAADFGVTASRVPGLRGVWVGNDKLAAIGIRLSQWVTSHGFALNINPDMAAFELIVPCGLAGRGVTSLAKLCGTPPSRQAVEAAIVRHSGDVLQRQPYAATARPSAAEAAAPF
jgi:lipoyl(octanoyl) transferase